MEAETLTCSVPPGIYHVLVISHVVEEAFQLTSQPLTSSTNNSFLLKEIEFLKAYTIHNKNHINTAINIVNIILITIKH